MQNSTTRVSVRGHFTAGTSFVALGSALLLMMSQSAFAQATAEEKQPAEDEIVVTGFRASIENSIEAKRSTDFIVDVVTADDIAGLPDVSIAESLARLPGVTSQRTGGQASAINIRGFTQDLVSATLNGREQVATSGERTIEFNQYPSELFYQAAVFKTPTASIIEGGIAGKVELKTVRPLDSKKSFSGQINARGVYNDRGNQSPDVSSGGYRVSASLQGKFFDDTLGVAIGYTRLFQPNVATRFVQFDFAAPGQSGSPLRDIDSNGTPDRFNFGFEGIQFGGREKRDGAVGVVQWEPNDKVHFLFDSYYSKLNSDVSRRGFRVFAPQSGENIIQNPVVVNNALVGGRFINNYNRGFAIGTELVNQDESRQDELYTFGGNLGYDITDRFKASVDVSYSQGTSFFNNSGVNVRPYFFDNRAGVNRFRRSDGSDTRNPSELLPPSGGVIVDYTLNGINLPTIREISQRNATLTDFDTSDGAGFLLDGQFLVPQLDIDRLFAVASDFSYRASDDGFIRNIKYGFRYANRRANRRITSFNTFGIPGGPLVLPSNLVSTAGFSGPYAAAGLPNFGVVDINGAFNLAFNNRLGSRQPTNQESFGFTIDQSFAIREAVYSAYGQVDFNGDVGPFTLRGNAGLRVVRTDQSSTVLVTVPNATDNPATIGVFENRRPQTLGRQYTDFLPSLNAIVDVTKQDLVRFSYSRQISRPRFFDLRGSVNVNTGADGQTSGSGGNPFLVPFRANQFDLGYEHYFGRGGLFSVVAYWKQLQSFIIGGTIPAFNFRANGLVPPPRPGTNIPGNDVGPFSTQINGQGGYVRGIEFNYTQSFKSLPAPFDGLGVQLNYAYSGSSIAFSSTTSGQRLTLPFPGLSEHVANPVIFFDKDGFGARLSARYRSGFVSPQIGVGELIVNSAPETVFDSQISYAFQKESSLSGLTLLLQVENLTDSPTRTFFGREAQTGTIQNFGRQFYFGATYKF